VATAVAAGGGGGTATGSGSSLPPQPKSSAEHVLKVSDLSKWYRMASSVGRSEAYCAPRLRLAHRLK
jgi:hypothetical protein